MKRKILSMVAVVAAVVPVAAVVAAPPAQSAEVVGVCITIIEKSVGFKINGVPIVVRIPAVDRTCAGI